MHTINRHLLLSIVFNPLNFYVKNILMINLPKNIDFNTVGYYGRYSSVWDLLLMCCAFYFSSLQFLQFLVRFTVTLKILFFYCFLLIRVLPFCYNFTNKLCKCHGACMEQSFVWALGHVSFITIMLLFVLFSNFFIAIQLIARILHELIHSSNNCQVCTYTHIWECTPSSCSIYNNSVYLDHDSFTVSLSLLCLLAMLQISPIMLQFTQFYSIIRTRKLYFNCSVMASK